MLSCGLQVLTGLGMTPAVPALAVPPVPVYCVVMLDGRVLGHVRTDRAPSIVARLRAIKAAALALLQPRQHPADAKVTELQVSAALKVSEA